MPEYLAPGVYVEEIDTGSKPIEGVSTSTAGMVGVTERGPVNVPILITSYGEFTRWFGDRLRSVDFSNANGPHCYLPQGVEGFFTNGGKRVFVVRVIDTAGAVQASTFLFDRGAANSANTVLLRAAGEVTGTAANPPLLVVLDATNLQANDWVRIGDGSTAEYVQVDVNPVAEDTVVPLQLPLNRTHAVGDTVGQFDRSPQGGLMTLVAPPTTGLAAGALSIVVEGANADIDFLAANPNQLLEIGGVDVGEYRFAVGVSNVHATTAANKQATLRLDSPLLLSYPNSADVTRLDLVVGPNSTASSTPSAGDRLVFVQARGGNFTDRTKLIVINVADTATREARRIGALRVLPVAPEVFEAYPAGSLVQAVTVGNQAYSLNGGTGVNATQAMLVSRQGIVAGQTFIVGAAGSQDTVVVRSLGPGANDITLAAPMANAHNNADPVVPAPRTLTAAAAAGTNFIALNNRVGLNVGDLLLVGIPPNDEYVTIVSLPSRAPAGTTPDAGTAMVTPALAIDHANGTQVEGQIAPTLVANRRPTVLVLPPAPGDTRLLVGDGDGYAAGQVARITTGNGEIYFHRVTAAPTIPAPSVVTLRTATRRAHAGGSVMVERKSLFQVQAIDAGAWGNRLRVSVEDEDRGLVQTQIRSIVNPTHLRLDSPTGVEAGTMLEFTDPLAGDAVVGAPLKVVGVDRASNYTLTFAGAGLGAAQLTAEANAALAGQHLGVRSHEFQLRVYLFRQPDPALPTRNETIIASEVFRNLSMDPRHSRYIHKIIGDTNGPLRLSDRRPEGESWYIRVHDLAQDLAEPNRTTTLESVRLGPETLIDVLPSGRERPARHALEIVLGDDSVPTLTDDTYIGLDDPNPENRTGLQSLRNLEEVSIVAAPGRTSAAIQGALIDHCELMRYRFAVLDGEPPPNDTLSDIQTQRQQFDTKYAALYHPWLLVPDPFPANLASVENVPIPPAGHVVGIYARTDIERGVHKAPANEVVRGILGLQRVLNKEEQDILNPYPVNINVIRDFRPNNRGIRVFGGRVITSDSDWKYVNVRRLLIFIEASIDRGLQWVVFEPNAEPLWARVRRTISNFLTLVWRNGALEGTKPEEAYFVKCDRTTMTQTDIDSGRLIVVIGVAPVKPAEFVIIRIGLWTAHAED